MTERLQAVPYPGDIGYPACCGEDPELFFPIGHTGPAVLQTEEAKAVCRRCGVREACLAWALEMGEEYGVWGGLSEGERTALERHTSHEQATSA